MKLIDKDALVAWAKETYLCKNASMIRKVCYKQLLEHLDTLEVKEVQEEPVSDVWHNTNEKPNYVEGDTYANSILVFGKTSLGYGASVGNMIDRDTIYSPMSRKEYKWGECPFTMWAYISDLLHKHEEPVSEDLEEAVHEYMQHIPESEPELMDSFYTWEQMEAAFKVGAKWQKEKMMQDAVERVVKADAGGYPYIDCNIELYDYDKDIPLAKDGDKVKIIVIK